MTPFEEVLASIKNICEKHRYKYLLIGGFANILHGSTGATRDIDLIIYIEYDEIDKLIKVFGFILSLRIVPGDIIEPPYL